MFLDRGGIQTRIDPAKYALETEFEHVRHSAVASVEQLLRRRTPGSLKFRFRGAVVDGRRVRHIVAAPSEGKDNSENLAKVSPICTGGSSQRCLGITRGT